VISLIELGRTDQALTFATAELAQAQKLTDMVVGAVDEPVLAALLLGKAAEANERGVELEVDPASTVPEGVIPARDLITVVGNLLDNAIDAAAAAPAPRRVGFSSWIEHGSSEGGTASTLVLRVSDSGTGLDDSSAVHAFTRGWSTKHDERLIGHGLGLALVGQATGRHHGTIEVGRAEDDGTVQQQAPLQDGGRDAFTTADVTKPNLPTPDISTPDRSTPDRSTPDDDAFVGAVFTVRLPLGQGAVP
jgi:two-component system CitB family sensor kinase